MSYAEGWTKVTGMDRLVILRLPCYSKCSIYNGWHIFSNRLVATVEMAETLKISLRFCAERER